jgi:outer membrane protein TolC
MKRCVSVVLLCFLPLLAMPCLAAETGTVTVRDLIAIGLKENISLQVEQLNVPLSSEAVEIEESVFDAELFALTEYSKSSTPVAVASVFNLADQADSEMLSGQVGLRKSFLSGMSATLSLDSEWTEDNSSTDDLNPRYRSAMNLNLVQPLLRDFGRKINSTDLQISRNQQNQSSLLHLLEAQSLALQIELLANQLAGEAKIVTLRTAALTLSKELYTSNKRRFDAGVIPVSEVQEAETALANRKLELSLAKQSRDLNYENLNRLLNHRLPPNFNPIALYSHAVDIEQPGLPSFEQLFIAAQEMNVALQLGELDVRNSDIQYDFYQNQLKPQLDLKLQAGLNGLSGDERSAAVTSRYVGNWSDSIGSAASADGYQWGAGLEFSIPLGNRQAKSRFRQADIQRKQASYRQRDLETELRSELQQQLINLNRAYDQVKIAEQFEKLARLSLQQEERRLEEGLSDTFRMILFQTNMVNAEIGRVDALIQYYSSLARLNFTRGIILEQHNITLQ